jgi:WD40 repeat protein
VLLASGNSCLLREWKDTCFLTKEGHSQNNKDCQCKHGWTYKKNADCPVIGHTHSVDSVAWSPDGKQIASSGGDEDFSIFISNSPPSSNASPLAPDKMSILTGHSKRYFFA